MEQKPLLICIVGPTAIGKTRLAIALATAFKTEILSADSRQFYKEMSIGTAVPSKTELQQAPHHFIQNKSIFETYTVGDFEREALDTLATLFITNEVGVLVGGSGLYVDAVVKGLDHFPTVPKEIRASLNKTLAIKGIDTLQKQLLKVDPISYKAIEIENPRRLIRALEIYKTTGIPYSHFKKANEVTRAFDTVYIGLTTEREIIYDRINKRVDLMMEQGLLKEVKTLLPHKELNALQTVGYKELFQYLEENISLDFAISEIKKNTRRFAKRQGTWFKKNEAIHWFDYKTPPSKILHYIQKNIIKNAP